MLFGHHLCLNVFIARQQMVIGPVFLGAEPNVCDQSNPSIGSKARIILTSFKIIDHGPDQGIELCADESWLGLRLMQSLPPDLQRLAQVYPNMMDASMPEDRWNPADQVRDLSHN